jgi:hypothetical protein
MGLGIIRPGSEELLKCSNGALPVLLSQQFLCSLRPVLRQRELRTRKQAHSKYESNKGTHVHTNVSQRETGVRLDKSPTPVK